MSNREHREHLELKIRSEVEDRLKCVVDSFSFKIETRVGKKEFMDTREFLLEENRQTLERMQRDRDSVNNLQWKYDNLDQLFITQQRFEKMAK